MSINARASEMDIISKNPSRACGCDRYCCIIGLLLRAVFLLRVQVVRLSWRWYHGNLVPALIQHLTRTMDCWASLHCSSFHLIAWTWVITFVVTCPLLLQGSYTVYGSNSRDRYGFISYFFRDLHSIYFLTILVSYFIFVGLSRGRREKSCFQNHRNSQHCRLVPPDNLLLDSAPNLGPLISRWEFNKFENCWYKSVRISEVLKLLFQQYLNLSSSQRGMSGPISGDLSNNRWSRGNDGGWLKQFLFFFLSARVLVQKSTVVWWSYFTIHSSIVRRIVYHNEKNKNVQYHILSYWRYICNFIVIINISQNTIYSILLYFLCFYRAIRYLFVNSLLIYPNHLFKLKGFSALTAWKKNWNQLFLTLAENERNTVCRTTPWAKKVSCRPFYWTKQ